MSQQTPANPADTESPHHLEQQRRENRDAMRELGLAPYGKRTEGLHALAAARQAYDQQADEDHKERGKEEGFEDKRPVVKVAGRVMLQRDNGKLVWLQLRDHTYDPADEQGGDLQIAVSKRDCEETGFNLAKILDLGDIIIAEGPLTKTRTGEVTIWASALDIACKSLAPPPEKWSGLQDPDLRYRKRYMDLYATPETMRIAILRSKMISRIRRFMDDAGYMEVETPMLQALAGGAAARPFVTHMNALDINLFMRIAPELYLKRLLVGGMPAVYEINRNFRNEGIDRQHNPEFTMLEVYKAFANYDVMRELTESLIRELATMVAEANGDPDNLALPFGDLTIDYARAFDVVTYSDLFERAFGFPMTDEAKVAAEAKKRSVEIEGLDHLLIVGKLFDIAEESIDKSRPTFVIDYPAPLCPLTRPKEDDPSLADRFELFIAGMELANAYTELNDPDIQELRFREQLSGVDEEEQSFRTFDADFVEALKVGMPPAGGLGVGIDRIVMLLTNQLSIRDVILFPFMRPLDD